MKMKEVHRMPVGFGPVKVPEVTQMAQVRAIEIAYETDASLLEQLILPHGVALTSAVVHVLYHQYDGCNLLAGRGYNSILLAFDGSRDGENGLYIPVRFTSDIFTLIDGRYGEYGFPDLYADIPSPAIRENGRYISASEYEHKFLELFACGFAPASGELLSAFREQRCRQNWLLDECNVTVVTRVDSLEVGEGSAVFCQSSWFDAPDICQIANYMKTLPVKKTLSALYWTGAMEIGTGGEL